MNQKIIHRFIFGKTHKAVFIIGGKTITLFLGDEKKGFRHIVEKHYHPNDLHAIDILNIIDIYKKGFKLHLEGVSNDITTVFMKLKRSKRA